MESLENLFEDFIKETRLLSSQVKGFVSTVTSSQLDKIRAASSVEAFLDYIVKEYDRLLHGSRNVVNIYLQTDNENKLYATDSGAIAILKAIISNKGLRHPGLNYPFFISTDNPLTVKINGINQNNVDKAGFVYVISDRSGFVNEPKGSWQHIKLGDAPVSAKLQVVRQDFKYPVFDVDNNAVLSTP